jgi:hypothetical protein
VSVAGHLDLVIDQGATFRARIEWTDAAGEPKTPVAPAVMEFRTSKGDLLARLTDTAGLTLAAGYVDVLLTDVQTAAMPKGKAKFDLFVHDSVSGDRDRLVEGEAEVRPAISVP